MSDKIKVSDIREKFPMYGDLSDEQLLGALRKKYYPDIPMDQFANRIEFDTERERLSPTEGMSGLEKFAAGAGAGMTNIARGIGQAAGIVSRGDVAESRKLDAPLLRSGAGLSGSILGTVAPMLATAAIPGVNTMAGSAGLGAGLGFLAPSESTGETLKNTALGGAIGPASILAGRGIAAGYQGIKGLMQPLTASGQQKVAASTLQQFAKDPKAAAAALKASRGLVPGSQPTMAQASGDPGLAQLERTLVNNPETGPELAARFAAQRAARLGAVKDIAGTDEYYNAIKQGRSLFAGEDYRKALAAGINPQKALELQPKIQALLDRPSIKQAANMAKELAAESGDVIDDAGSLKGMDYLAKALDNTISKAQSPGSSIGKEKLRALMNTKDELMGVLEEIAPAYKEARSNFAAMSKQVNAMDVARELQKKFEPALSRYGANTREHANAFATALEGATESVKKQTGMNLPLNQVMPSDDIASLTNVARDLASKARAEDLGRSVGSNTAQNLAAQNLLRRALGPTGLPQSWSESTGLQTLLAPATGLYKLGGAERKILGLLQDAALDPNLAATLLELERQATMAGQIGARAQPYLPAAAMSGLLGYPRQ